MKSKLINHVALVIDDSPSMAHLVSKTRDVVNAQIKGFRNSAVETRLSIYTFGGTVKCIDFDLNPASAQDARYFIHAMNPATAVRDAVSKVVDELYQIPTHRGDHAFLVYVITDGEDNASRVTPEQLSRKLDSLNDDWTIGVMVPNVQGKHHAKICGLPVGNIEIWDTTSEQGMEDVGSTICDSYIAYSAARAVGTKSTKQLFNFKDDLKKRDVAGRLDVVPAGDYNTYLVRKADDGKAIRDFVEYWTKEPYRVGSSYYQLTKPEIIQASKQLAVIEKQSGRMYSGRSARPALGLPNYEVKVAPADFDKFDVFVQSTSTNRKLVAGTSLIVFT